PRLYRIAEGRTADSQQLSDLVTVCQRCVLECIQINPEGHSWGVGMSLADWLSDADYEWRQRLKPVSLVIETNFTEDEVREAQRKLGIAVRQLRKRDVHCSKIIKRYPGLLLMVLVGHASLAYDQGAYWESFW